MHGKGKETFPNTSTYSGYYINGERNGLGISQKSGCSKKYEIYDYGRFIR